VPKKTDKVVGHEERAHAVLSPSSASRWMTCTKSIEMIEQHGEPDTSTAAAELGTAVHELIEDSWNAKKYPGHKVHRKKLFNKKFALDEGMIRKATIAYDYMLGLELDGYEVHAEKRVSIACTREFGTVDITAWNPETKHLVVADYKNGRYPVNPVANKQGRLYALGIIDELVLRDKIDRLTICIIQPEVSEEPNEFEDRLIDLFKFEKAVRKVSIQIKKGETVFAPNQDNCHFCPASGSCKARTMDAISKLKMDFDVLTPPQKRDKQDPKILTPMDINNLMGNMELINSWIKGVQQFAFQLALEDKLLDFKLVQKRGSRKWTDEKTMADALLRMGYDEDDVYDKKVKGIGAVEDLFFTKTDSVNFTGKHTMRPNGSLSLVSRDHPADAVTTEASTCQDFDSI